MFNPIKHIKSQIQYYLHVNRMLDIGAKPLTYEQFCNFIWSIHQNGN